MRQLAGARGRPLFPKWAKLHHLERHRCDGCVWYNVNVSGVVERQVTESATALRTTSALRPSHSPCLRKNANQYTSHVA